MQSHFTKKKNDGSEFLKNNLSCKKALSGLEPFRSAIMIIS